MAGAVASATISVRIGRRDAITSQTTSMLMAKRCQTGITVVSSTLYSSDQNSSERGTQFWRASSGSLLASAGIRSLPGVLRVIQVCESRTSCMQDIADWSVDSTQTLQLQDELEYFTSGQDPAALARKAFNLAVAKVDKDSPPPVPPKDYRVNHKASLQDIMKETESWTQFVRSITNDEYLPTGVTHVESGVFDEEMSWYDDETF